jgi:hypothetical protein
MTLRIMTLSIKCLLVILNINNVKLDTLALHVLLNIINTKFNDIQHNDTEHIGLICDIQHK